MIYYYIYRPCKKKGCTYRLVFFNKTSYLAVSRQPRFHARLKAEQGRIQWRGVGAPPLGIRPLPTNRALCTI